MQRLNLAKAIVYTVAFLLTLAAWGPAVTFAYFLYKLFTLPYQ